LEQRMNSVADNDRTALWLILRGTLPAAAKARLDEVLDHFTDLFAPDPLGEGHMHLPVRAADEDCADPGWSGDRLARLGARRPRAGSSRAGPGRRPRRPASPRSSTKSPCWSPSSPYGSDTWIWPSSPPMRTSPVWA